MQKLVDGHVQNPSSVEEEEEEELTPLERTRLLTTRTANHLKRSQTMSRVEIIRTDFSSSLLGPQILIRCSPSASVKPCLVHLNCSNTSSTGMCSCVQQQQLDYCIL